MLGVERWNAWGGAGRARQKGRCTEMLVLTRKSNQSIMIGDEIQVSVLSIAGEKVRIGIQAPKEIPVFRTEIYVEIHGEEDEGTPKGMSAPM
jgi:carbon storage regulator